MAIKKLTFSFDVPITQLLSLIATGNAGLRIDVLGDDKTHALPRLINGHAPKLLEGPKKTPGQMPGWHMLIKTLAKDAEHTSNTRDLAKLLVAHGLSAKSVSPQLSMLQKKGWARRIGEGTYQLTAKGGIEAGRLGFEVAHRRVKKAKTLRSQLSKKKPKPPAEPEAAPVAAEQDHG